jgi:hypothetical protein
MDAERKKERGCSSDRRDRLVHPGNWNLGLPLGSAAYLLIPKSRGGEKMSKNWFWVKALAALIIIGLLILGGLAIHRVGWSQGYKLGQLAAGGEKSATVPYAAYGFRYSGLFLTIGLLLLLLIVVGKIFRFWAWKTIGGPWMMAHGPQGEYWAKHWARHWHRPHGPMPPWCWDWEEPDEEKAKPDAETGAAEA